jgi:hypothetical protein
MAQFKTVEDVKQAFLIRSNGSDSIQNHAGIRYSDIDKHAHIVERLLDTDYNHVSGFTFSEIMEAISTVATNYNSPEYVNNARQGAGAMQVTESMASTSSEYFALNEAFDGTTISQAPFPVPAVSLVTYQYEKSVIPFLAHQFDLKGNRGMIYYQKITAKNAKGNVAQNDLLGKADELGVQNVAFVGTRAVNYAPDDATNWHAIAAATTSYTLKTGIINIQPGSVAVTIPGVKGALVDIALPDSKVAGTHQLLCVGGAFGTGTVNYETGDIVVTLADNPDTDLVGTKFVANFAIDIEEPTTTQMGEVEIELESKQLVAENFSVKTHTNLYQEALAKAIFGIQWNTVVDDALAALYNKEIANKITSEIRAKIKDNVATHDISKGITAQSGALGGNNALFNVQFISVVMGKLKQLIQKSTGLALTRLTTLVVNVDVLPVLEALPKYKQAENQFEDNMGGMVLVGTYDGIPVLCGYAPIIESGEIMGIFKSKKQDFLTPYAFGTFVLPVLRDIYDQNNLAVNRKQLIASAAGEVVAERLSAKMTITGINDII